MRRQIYLGRPLIGSIDNCYYPNCEHYAQEGAKYYRRSFHQDSSLYYYPLHSKYDDYPDVIVPWFCIFGNRPLRYLGRIKTRNSQRQSKSKTSSLLWMALHSHPTAMGLHHLLDDGQAKSCAASSASARSIGTIETFEDIRQVFGSNALAAILDTDAYLVPINPCIHENFSTKRCMREGIAQ